MDSARSLGISDAVVRPVGQIIVGFDGSPSAQQALEWAAKEAVASDTPLRIITCSSVPDAIDYYGTGARQHQRLDAAADALGSVHPYLKVDTVTTHHDPRDALTVGLAASDLLVIGAPAHRSAASWLLGSISRCASLLVLGSRGRSGFKTLLFGSVVRQVAADAQCPVWILHPQPFRGSDSE